MRRKAYPDRPILDVRHYTSYYYRLLGLFIFSFCFLFLGNGQTVILQESFETDGEGTRYTSNTADAVVDFWNRDNRFPHPELDPAFVLPAAQGTLDGSYYWTGEDIFNLFSGTIHTEGLLTLNPLTVTGYSSLELDIAVAHPRHPDLNRWDWDDHVFIEYNMDGAGWNVIALFRGNTGVGSLLFLEPDLVKEVPISVADQGNFTTVVPLAFTDFNFSIPATGNSLQVRVRVASNGTEELAFDNIRISGVLTTNVAPVLSSIEVADININEGDPAVQVTNTLVVTDSDDTQMQSATVSITGGFDNTEDVLAFTSFGGIAGIYNSATGILSLSGTASIADYQSTLRSVTYQNTDVNDASPDTRTISFLVNDGINNSNIETRDINVATSLNTTPASLPFCESFEDPNGEGTRYGSNHFTNGCQFAERGAPIIGSPSNCFAETITGEDGSFVFNTEATRFHLDGSGDFTLTSQPFDIVGLTGLQIDILLGVSRDDEDRFENDRQVRIEYSIDNGPFIIAGLFTGTDPDPFQTSGLFQDLDNDPGTLGPFGTDKVTDVFNNFTFNFTGSGSTLRYRIVVVTQGSEEVAFDKICLSSLTINTAPTAVCQNVTVDADANCQGAAMAAAFDGGSTDPESDPLTFSVSPTGPYSLGTTNVVLTVSDGNLQSTCNATITVEDNADPTAVCMDATVQLDASGNATIAAADINNGSSDNCGIANLSVSPNSFDCDDIGVAGSPNDYALDFDGGNDWVDAAGNGGNKASAASLGLPTQDITVECWVNPRSYIHFRSMAGFVHHTGTFHRGWALQLRNGNKFTFALNSVGGGGFLTYLETTNTFSTNTWYHVAGVYDGATMKIYVNGVLEATSTNENGDIWYADAWLALGMFKDDNEAESLPGTLDEVRIWNVAKTQAEIQATMNNTLSGSETGLVAYYDFEDGPASSTATDVTGNGLNGTLTSMDPGTDWVTGSPVTGGSGANGVTLTVTDNSDNVSTCTANVTVEDNIAPAITCPANMMVDNDPGQCDAVVSFNPTADDNCSGVMVTSMPMSGSTFDIGTTTVTATATDASGNTAQCSFDVTVNDTEDPTITCPSDIVMDNDAGLCSAVVSFNPTGNDNCPGVSVASIPMSGSAFDVGTTTVTATATDAAGNTAQCSFNVTVNDTEPPTIACSGDIFVESDPGQCGANVDFGFPATGDNCPGTSGSYSPSTGSFFPVGMTVVTGTAFDGGPAFNSSQCTFTVTVLDFENPTITCPDDIVVDNDPGECSAVVNFSPTVDDNCPDGVSLTLIPMSGSTFPVGTTEVFALATDAAGNAAECLFNVTVNDTESPTITCPPDYMTVNNPGQCGALQEIISFVSLSDNCDDLGSLTIITSHPSVDFYEVGSTEVTTTVTDLSGKSAQCTFNVIITDVENPVAACNDITIDLVDENTYNLSQTDIDAIANGTSDNCPGVDYDITGGPTAFDCDDVGMSFQITLTATDAVGNTDVCQAQVTIEDANSVCNAAPMAVCQDISIRADANCQATVIAADFDGGSSDPDGDPLTFSVSPPAPYPLGTTNVVLTVSDGDLQSMCNAMITVIDSTRPSITCPADITVSNDPGECGANVTIPAATASDNCGVVFLMARFREVDAMGDPVPGPTGDWSSFVGDPSGFFAVGRHRVQWRARDAAGNRRNCNVFVQVNDTEQPQMFCPPVILVNTDPDTCGAVVPFSIAAQDNCPGVITSSVPAGGTFFPTGTTNVTGTAVDSAGNMNTCNFDVVVSDNQAPDAVCVPSLNVYLDANGQATIDENDLDNGSTDNCGIVSRIVNPSTVNCNLLGTFDVVLLVFDAAGLSDFCNTAVTVLDTITPSAPIPPMDVTVACASEVPAPVDLTASDNCGDITVSPVIQITPGSCINDFVEVRTWTFTDESGNSSSVSQTITVLDTLAPVAPTPPADVKIQCAADVPPPVDLTATDNCDGAITVSPSAVITPGDCANQFTEVRTWTFTDNCGNSSSVSQTIMVNDTIRPTFDRPRPPRNVEASCGQIPPVPVVTATDNCDGPVPVTFEQTDNGGAGFEYDPLIITRTWTAMDECGNTRRRRQTITVIDCPDPCNIEGITVGSTTTRMMAGPVCNGDGTYDVEICIQWKGNPMPDFIEVEINGTGGFIQIPIDGPQDYPEKCFTLENLPANGRNVMIFARIGREGCTYRARDLFRAPDRCDPPPTECDITGANVQIAPTCDNGTVSTCIMIEGALLPQDASNARAFVGGQPVEITQYTLVTGGAVVCFQGLRADGGSKDFFFQAEPGCSITKRGFLRMPRSCDGDPGDDDDDDCDITGMRNPVVNCDGNGTYSLSFDVTYNDMPNGQLAVEVGHGANKTWSYHAVTGSPQTITVTGLPAVGGYANVFIKSNDVGGCTWYERSWYRAPDNCGRNRDSNFSTTIDQIRVYPNPSEGKFFLLIEQETTEMIEVAVSNALGQVVKTLKVESNREELLDLNEMPEGIYTLRIMQGEVPVYRQVQVQR